MPATALIHLPAVPASVRAARTSVRAVLDAWRVDTQACDDTSLVLSELVTNVIAHTGSADVVCRLTVRPERLDLEVENAISGCGSPQRRQVSFEEEGGRGLLLVGALSSEWGVRSTAGGEGRVVWAQIPCEPLHARRGGAVSPASAAA